MKKFLICLVSCLALLLSFSSAALIKNPLIPNENNPDPGVIFYQGVYYAATTNPNSTFKGKFAIHKSYNIQNWQFVGPVFSPNKLPTWAISNGAFWAPEIHIINGKFRVYYTAREKGTNILCIGVATADNITGPYVDSGAPLIKNLTVGSIDPSVMTLDNGKYYLIWKDDGNGNNPKLPTWIWAQELTNDGLNVTGPKTQLIRNTLAWEGSLVEAPWIIKRGNWYYLFYSGDRKSVV